MTQLHLGRNDCGIFERAIEHEWLVTNGIGGFAAGTVCETNTRRYHGLLVAALTPPVARTLLVAALETTARYGTRAYPLFTHEFGDGTLAPHGFLQIESFHLDRGMPVWRYAFADALLEKRLLMEPGRNTTLVEFRLLRGAAEIELELTPLCAYRDYHSHSHGGWDPGVEEIADGFRFGTLAGSRPCQVTCNRADFVHDPAWYWNFRHREETARGLDDREDLFRPGRFRLPLAPGEHATLTISTESAADSFAAVQAQVLNRHHTIVGQLPGGAPEWVKQLARASDQFIVERYRDNQPIGKTVIAGYPWFSDWGRDTMIALPGLTLATRRYTEAAAILRTFAEHVSDGMLPNRFPDGGEAPEYNTVDAALWYFHAIDQYTRHSHDPALAAELYPLLRDIIAWHRRGTRYSIGVDAADGLLASGQDGVQLTWMDAKVGDWVVTPRIGKCVEINALWYNALKVMEGFANRLNQDADACDYADAAEQVRDGFRCFWNPRRRALYDVIDGPEGEPGSDGRICDDRLRPNQLFAVSLPHSPLDAVQQKAVVDVCAHALLTSHGLRSLAPGEQGYVAHYTGGPRARDGAYHQGTVWAWLIGPFVDAHYRVYRDATTARSFLEPLALQLQADCLGTVSEIFDAAPPFKARGCFAQAWSVAELLRAWLHLSHP